MCNHGSSREVPRHEYTVEKLDEHLVAKAKAEELKFFASKGVSEVVPRGDAQGQQVMGTRCVSCNKGDLEYPEVRSRLFAQEVKTYATDAFFAATPPVEMLR